MYISSNKFSFVSRRYVVAAILSIITLLFITSDSGPNLETWRTHLTDLTHTGHKGGWKTRKQFVDAALDHDIYVTEYDGAAVRKLCGEAKWRDDRIVECNRLAGGIGNLKINLLGCARFAIEAGAILITPVLHPREAFEKMENSFGWDKDLPISYMFDEDHFFDTMAKDCPQLRMVDEDDPAYNIPPRSETHVVRPKGLIPTKHANLLIDPSLWRPAFDKHVDEIVQQNGLPPPTSERPIRMSFDDVAFSWPVRYDGDEFRSDFGHIARFPRHIRELSARALYNLYQELGVDQSPSAPSVGAFLGAHVRTEADAQMESWTSFDKQAEQIRLQLELHQLGALYVATGTASDVDRLRADLSGVRVRVNDTHTTGVRVLQKWDILDEADVMILDTLTWDQMALVDLDIMLRASRFVGIWESSWSWTIALKRHAWSALDPYDYEAHPVTYQDEFSILYGNIGAQPIIDPCMWL
ncbi:hypothetical protein diail_414 [Diaporthe ilicicola]|nr:hypothetical protein diail_414 [Diaporthe ilicicola]